MTQLQRKQATKVPEIRTGDTVVVLTGKDAGKRGLVERIVRDPRGMAKTKMGGGGAWKHVSPLSQVAVVVEGLNVAKRHTKPRTTSSSTDRMPKVQQGGILEIPQPMPVSKVMVVCTSCDRPTRVKHLVLDNGQRVRVCGHCGERLEVKA
ncbi:MAG: large subunit ribosomal protein [Chloroflexota bacterium]|jgi:large subunit ribosomal protein L24|nr:large subunit ribosomal protein [Chloroflexota bacterium]